MIYLDNAATTPVAPEVAEQMYPFLNLYYGNPASNHYALASHSKIAVESARNRIADLVKASPDEIVFTSSASESNNFIIKGIMDQVPGKELIITSGEHSSTFGTAQYLESKGHKVHYLPIDSTGTLNLRDLSNAINQRVALVSINLVNNELGAILPLEEIAELCHKHRVLLHIDATQAIGKLELDVTKFPIDYLSISAHKIYGPKGIGACFISKTSRITKLTPLIHGGGQEWNLRAGTLGVHNIVGFGAAAELLKDNREFDAQRALDLERLFIDALAEAKLNMRINSTAQPKIPGLISLTLFGINNEILLRALKDELALSTGSACSATQPSRVLLAAGMPLSEVRNTVRVSFGRYNTPEEAVQAAHLLTKHAKRLHIL